MQLRAGNVDRKIFSRPMAFKYENGFVQRSIEFKAFPKNSNVKRKETMSSAKRNGVWNKNFDNEKNIFAGLFK